MTVHLQTMAETAAEAQRTGYNHYGQKIGSKGERTRQLLIDATVDLLGSHGLREVSVVDVARAASTSSATFYVYFRGVPEAVLAALENAAQTSSELEALIGHDWLVPGAAAYARAVVETYTELWNRNRTIFCVRNLAAEEGDDRFYQARAKASGPVMQALVEQIVRAQVAGRTPADLAPRACAGVLLMMLERLSSVGPITREDGDLDYASLKAAAAHSLADMLGARG